MNQEQIIRELNYEQNWINQCKESIKITMDSHYPFYEHQLPLPDFKKQAIANIPLWEKDIVSAQNRIEQLKILLTQGESDTEPPMKIK